MITLDGRPLRTIGSYAMLDDQRVRVTALQIQPGHRVAYEVVWYGDGRHEVWVEEFELADEK